MEPTEISLLIEKLKNNSITASEIVRLKELVDSSTALADLLNGMQEEYKDLADHIDDLDRWDRQKELQDKVMMAISGEKKVFPNQYKTDDPPKNLWNPFGVRKLVWIAAVAAIVLVGFVFLFSPEVPQKTISWETIRTEHGERKKFMLSDNTAIILNGNSSFSYPKNQLKNIRLVKLSGEAFFDVTKDKEKPFVILTADFTTKVLGTSFNIDSDIERSVEVNTGVVEIQQSSAYKIHPLAQENLDSIAQYLSNSKNHKLTLRKGEKANLTAEGWQVQTSKHQNWHNNELIYMNEPLEQVLRKAYRYFGDSVAVSKKLANTKISISFRKKNMQQVLQTLAELSGGTLIKKNDHEWEIM